MVPFVPGSAIRRLVSLLGPILSGGSLPHNQSRTERRIEATNDG